MRMRPVLRWSARRAGVMSAVVALAAGPAALAHEGIMHIGRTSAGVLVIADFEFDDLFTLPVADPPLAGWAGHEPAFQSVGADDPGADVFALDAAAKISVEVVLFTTGVKLWNHDLSFQVSQPGESISLGPLPFTDSTVWHLDSAQPGFDPGAGEWSASFRLVDAGTTAYTPSASYTLRLGVIPAPSAIASLGVIAGAGLARRRRGR